MIHTLQKKFVVTAMTAVTILLVALLGILNIANALTVSSQNEQLLDMLALQESVQGSQTEAPEKRENMEFPEKWAPPPGARGDGGFFRDPLNEDSRMSALYFVVHVDEEDTVLAVDLRHIASVDKEKAESLASQVAALSKTEGKIGDLKYKVIESADSVRSIVFLDIGRQARSTLRVVLLSALAGALAWIAMLILVKALSRRAIRPIAENMERQRQFVTDAGHELKTPLAIILANTDAMELTGGESKYSRNIRSQVVRLNGLMQNLLTLAKIDETSKALDLSNVPFSELARESLDMFRESAALKNIRIESEIQEGLCLQANRQQMSQLLSTLLDNAVKYCPEGGEIALSLRKEDKIVLRLRNSAGPERIDTERIFDRFYRVDSARTQKGGGYGIGLSAAQAIVQLHKGQIRADYEGDDIVFTVKL